MREFTPLKILIFLGSCLVVMALISAVFPENGIRVTEKFVIKFPTLTSIFNEEEEKTDISSITAIKTEDELKADSIRLDKINADKVELDSTVKLLSGIQYGPDGNGALDKFFSALHKVKNSPESIRILHYGDSQIEGDRITAYLRLKLQFRFGGKGTGFISPMPVAESVGITNTWSENWDRYNIFNVKDKRVAHSNFGPAAGFCRFRNYWPSNDSMHEEQSAWLKVKTFKTAGENILGYNKVKMHYAGGCDKTIVEFYENGELKQTDTLAKGGFNNIQQYPLSAGPGEFELKFKGKDSPDIYGFSLEGDGGVMVDNFGLRGSLGLFYNRMNLTHLKQFYDNMHVKLIILQFGGNALPGLEDEQDCTWYTNAFKAQVNSIKKIAPDASILIIGPADMSVKEGTKYVTHPMLETVRDQLKQVAFDTNSAFFDMYACMGGKNSMVSWVEAGIAAKDYIHFSPSGSRKIAVLLYQALLSDYNTYLQTASY